jgi:hypothetical protein
MHLATVHEHMGAGIAQSVERLATGWTTEFSLPHVAQIDSGAHKAYQMGTGVSSPEDKVAGA